jgi:hypothetical protein
LALGLSAKPALAFKNIQGCDIVVFASKDAPVSIPPERWQAYHDQVESLLSEPPTRATTDWRGLASRLVELQKSLLGPDTESGAYRDYLAGDSCRVLAKLDSGAIQSFYDEVAQAAPEQAATSLRRVAEAARAQIDRIERTARFTSGQARTLMAAQFHCFVAGAIVALLPPERRAAMALDDFGQTVSCHDAGRTG